MCLCIKHSITRMSQKFCNILVIWGKTRVSQKFSSMLVAWRKTKVSLKFCQILIVGEAQLGNSRCFCGGHKGHELPMNFKMPSSPDTLLMLLVEFTSTNLSTASESTVLVLPDLVWLSFMHPERNFFTHLISVSRSTLASLFVQMFFCFFCGVMAQFKLEKHKSPY